MTITREHLELAALAAIEAQEPVALVETSGDQGAGIGWSGAAQAVPMSDERIDAIAELVIKGMPDGILGFMRTWGYQQFARALLGVCAGHYRAQAVPESVDGLVSVLCYDEVLTFTFCDEDAADKFASRFDPSVDSAAAPEHGA